LALIFFVCIHLISVYFFAVHRFAVSYDALISPQTQSAITAYVNSYPTYALNFALLEQSLKQKFSCIASIQASAQPNGIIKLHIDTIRPLYLLNDKYMITAHNSIINADYYTDAITQKIPTLQMALQSDQKNLSEKTFAYISTLCTLALSDMAVFWKQPHDIHIHLPTDNIKLRCNANTMPTQELFDRCIQIAQEHNRSSTQAKKVLADIRFDNQIIVSKIKKLGESL
jgi:hypothetical protein